MRRLGVTLGRGRVALGSPRLGLVIGALVLGLAWPAMAGPAAAAPRLLGPEPRPMADHGPSEASLGSAGLDAADTGEAPASATPACPADAGLGPDGEDAPCTSLKVHGNTYLDNNRNGRYDSHQGDTRLAGIQVKLVDPHSGAVLGQAVTNDYGYYSFPLLPVGPSYAVVAEVPPLHRPTTPTERVFELRDFSTYWCCSARADFGFFASGHGPGPGVPPPPGPGPGGPLPKPPCCEQPSGQQTHLPILNYEANDNVCTTIIEAQNVGAWDSKAILVVWGAPGACAPQCTGPLKIECSGLLRPGSTWNFVGAQLPARAKSGMVFSAPAISAPGSGDVFADLLCERLFELVVGDCNEYRRFKKAYNEHGVWLGRDYGFDFAAYPGASLAVEVVRKCPGDLNPMVNVTGGYVGLADEMLGAYDPVYGGYSFYAPLVYADHEGWASWLYVQNGGLECSSVEIWFSAQGDCLRPKICEVLTLAPGETFQYDASNCVGPGWVGSAMLRGSEPLSVVVDLIGHDVLMSYHGQPGELKYSFDGPGLFSSGSPVLYGPLLYSEYQGWDASIQVQNLSTVVNAKVKIYFLDRSGNVITTLSDWICPGGSQGFYLPVVASMPGNWVGSVRVESQDWFSPGQPAVSAPNVAAIAQLVKYADISRQQPLEAMAYGLLPEQRAYDWQIGSGWGGLYSGVGRIGIPSLMKDVGGLGLTTEIAIANLVAKPGFTDFVIYIYDQNGLVTHLCEKLHQQQVEYLDVGNNLAFLPEGFKGSGVISAVFWEHDVFDGQGRFLRNLVGLAAVKVERTGTLLGADVPGDESAASIGIPIIGPFSYSGFPPNCPGVPSHRPCCLPPGGPGQPAPAPTAGPPPAPPPPGPPIP